MRVSIRFQVLERDQFRCRYCGRAASADVVLQVDHVHPKSKGGSNDPDNLVTACWDCNIGKGARVLRPIPGPKRRYNVRTPSRDVDIEALRAEFPIGSHCSTPLKIAAMGQRFGVRSYPAAHKFVTGISGGTKVPMPPLRKTDHAWWRIVHADPMYGRTLSELMETALTGTYTPWFVFVDWDNEKPDPA